MIDLTYQCEICDSINTKVNVKVGITIHPKYAHKLTKKAFKTKDVQINYALWDGASVFCLECGHYYYFDKRLSGEREVRYEKQD